MYIFSCEYIYIIFGILIVFESAANHELNELWVNPVVN